MVNTGKNVVEALEKVVAEETSHSGAISRSVPGGGAPNICMAPVRSPVRVSYI